MIVTIDLAVLIVIVLYFRLYGKWHGPRSKVSVRFTALLALVLGLLLIGTSVGDFILSCVHQVVAMLNGLDMP